MLVGFEQFEVRAGSAVEDWLELHLESAVGAGEAPGRKIILFSVLHGYLKCDMVQLVESAVINERVFRRGGGIAEAVAEVPAERRAVQKSGRARPVPRVVIRPDAASPVEDGKKFVRRQLEPLCTKLHPAGRAQAVDLLIVVKMAGLVEGRGNDDALNRLVRQRDDALDRDISAEVVHVK